MKSKKRLLKSFLLGGFTIVPSSALVVGCSVTSEKLKKVKDVINEILDDKDKNKDKDMNKDTIEALKEFKAIGIATIEKILTKLKEEVEILEGTKLFLEKSKVEAVNKDLIKQRLIIKALEALKEFKTKIETLEKFKAIKIETIEKILTQLKNDIETLKTKKKLLFEEEVNEKNAINEDLEKQSLIIKALEALEVVKKEL